MTVHDDERAAARDARDHEPGYGPERPTAAELHGDEAEAVEWERALIERLTVRIDGWNYWRGSRA